MGFVLDTDLIADLRDLVVELNTPDTVEWLAWTPLRDADGQEAGETWVVAGQSPCKFIPAGSRETGTNQVTTQDRIKLPAGVFSDISSRDRLRLAERYMEGMGEGQQFSIDGVPLVKLTSTTLNLQRVTT